MFHVLHRFLARRLFHRQLRYKWDELYEQYKISISRLLAIRVESGSHQDGKASLSTTSFLLSKDELVESSALLRRLISSLS